MKYFPGIKVNMGSWSYFTIKMKFSDLDKYLTFAKYLSNPSSLDAFLQRNLLAHRAATSMRKFLTSQDERFYSAITLANMQDSDVENWKSLRVPDTAEDLPGIEPGSDELGYFKIDDNDKYYILDGQHRVASILSIINPDSLFLDWGDEEDKQKKIAKIEENMPLPENFDMEAFKNEHLTVMILNKTSEDENLANISYRRLFSNLNRYAKPTDTKTNIIMSEDDTFYILTRRLVENFEPFSLENSGFAIENDNINILSNSMDTGQPHFTPLVTLANLNEQLLSINKFPALQGTKLDSDVRAIRQDDELLDVWYAELENRWKAILNVFSELKDSRDRVNMRNHSFQADDTYSDHPFLWPIIQTKVIMPIIKDMLDEVLEGESYEDKLQELKDLDIWDYRKAPWYPYILVDKDILDPEGSDKIIRQDTEETLFTRLQELIRYLVGLNELTDDDLETLEAEFMAYLVTENEEIKENFWQECLDKKL